MTRWNTDDNAAESERGAGPVAMVLASAAAILIPMGLYFGTHAFLDSSTFLLREVEVVGAVMHERQEVLEVADLVRPRNVLSLRSESVARAVEQLDWVREAHVARARGRRLVIEVRETRWRSTAADGTLWLVGEDSLPIRRWTPADGIERPLIFGFADASDPQDERVRLDRQAIREAHALLDRIAEHFPQSSMDVMELEKLPASRYRVVTRGGTEVLLASDDLEFRLERLAGILERLESENRWAERILLDGEQVERVAVRLARDRDEED
ncbi:MAG: FtsQ-type POTRA domain-containing protein [Deltaproteobacteria bacterium]|nr:MAG: FtsQ-type POTRA domain-containing protein [Deltaproteobacteria bacterium]